MNSVEALSKWKYLHNWIIMKLIDYLVHMVFKSGWWAVLSQCSSWLKLWLSSTQCFEWVNSAHNPNTQHLVLLQYTLTPQPNSWSRTWTVSVSFTLHKSETIMSSNGQFQEFQAKLSKKPNSSNNVSSGRTNPFNKHTAHVKAKQLWSAEAWLQCYWVMSLYVVDMVWIMGRTAQWCSA